MTTPNTTNLPYRFSERHFRRYENILKTITIMWPVPTIIDPVCPDGRRLSLETYSCRLRDAKKSLRDNQWDSTVPLIKFMQIVDEIEVSIIPGTGKIGAGPYGALRKLIPAGTPVEQEEPSQPVPRINLINPDVELIRAVLLMHHHRIFVEPSTITTTTPISAEGLDIEVTKNGNVYTIY